MITFKKWCKKTVPSTKLADCVDDCLAILDYIFPLLTRWPAEGRLGGKRLDSRALKVVSEFEFLFGVFFLSPFIVFFSMRSLHHVWRNSYVAKFNFNFRNFFRNQKIISNPLLMIDQCGSRQFSIRLWATCEDHNSNVNSKQFRLKRYR